MSKPVRSVSDCTRWIRDGVVPSSVGGDLHVRRRGALAEFHGADGDLVDAVVAQRRPRLGDVVGRRRGLVHRARGAACRRASPVAEVALVWSSRRNASSTRSMHSVRPSSVNDTSSGCSPSASEGVARPDDVAPTKLQRVHVERDGQFVHGGLDGEGGLGHAVAAQARRWARCSCRRSRHRTSCSDSGRCAIGGACRRTTSRRRGCRRRRCWTRCGSWNAVSVPSALAPSLDRDRHRVPG